MREPLWQLLGQCSRLKGERVRPRRGEDLEHVELGEGDGVEGFKEGCEMDEVVWEEGEAGREEVEREGVERGGSTEGDETL